MNTRVLPEQVRDWRERMRREAKLWRVMSRWGKDDPETFRALHLAKLYRDLANGDCRQFEDVRERMAPPEGDY